ncbi:MAG: hypothetical protein AMJ79_14725 [Phycisphaerae bacterium SM23_30]|nr:MAG: hypothetical protein AMJ79_14725 [Phycisphaerae bacterium SM23_30]
MPEFAKAAYPASRLLSRSYYLVVPERVAIFIGQARSSGAGGHGGGFKFSGAGPKRDETGEIEG